MKRFLVFSVSMLLCGAFSGCGSDTHDGLVSDTISRIGLAATEVGNIKSRVNEAVTKAKDGKKLDLSAAIEATKKLKETGDEMQKLKRRIEQVRSEITEEEKKANVDKNKVKLNTAFTDLLKQKEELRTALAEAEKISPTAKSAVTALREKLVEAESPFEALSR